MNRRFAMMTDEEAVVTAWALTHDARLTEREQAALRLLIKRYDEMPPPTKNLLRPSADEDEECR